MRATHVTLDENAIVDGVKVDLEIVLSTIGRMTRDHAEASMKQHQMTVVKRKNGQSRQAWVGKTPIGEPPRARKGLIRENIQSAQQDGAVFVGPIALPGHRTECMARLEYGDHPFMQPALNAVIPQLPEVWQKAITQ